MSQDSLHAKVGESETGFSRILPVDNIQPTRDDLEALANLMADVPDTIDDAPDPEENLMIPAGYTYFGQFVDHDLTFDTTSTLNFDDKTLFTNLRTPRFDLDNVYGPGPDAAPFMYIDGVKLVEGIKDLPRVNANGRAVIGDPRNDENSIVCQIQMGFLRFHNLVVDKIGAATGLKAKALFLRAQQEVRWTYQKILVDDFLPRIISNETLKAFELRRAPSPTGLSLNPGAFKLFTEDKRAAIPLEFTAGAYRFGHSMVRNGYRLNSKAPENKFPIFLAPPGNGLGPGDDLNDKSLVGFDPLPKDGSHLIDSWSRFFPDANAGNVTKAGEMNDDNDKGGIDRLQYAYRIDTSLVNPLAHLPQSVAGAGETEFRLAARNLLRGAKFGLSSGQVLADTLGVPRIPPEFLKIRQKNLDENKKIKDETFVDIDAQFKEKTPLWFYILAEAQMNEVDWWITAKTRQNFTEDEFLGAAGKNFTQLGEAGGRVVLEVFHGLLDSDSDSYRNASAAAAWKPLIKSFTVFDLVNGNFA